MAIYLSINGIQGTSTDAAYPGWIVVSSIHWGIHVDVSTTVGSSGNRLSAGKITPSDVSIQKDFDTASIPLLNLAFAGTSSNQPVIIGVTQTAKPANDTSKYLEYTLTNVIISSFSQGAGSSGTPTDSFTLNFTKCNLLAAPTGADNTPQQTVGGYDFALAQPC